MPSTTTIFLVVAEIQLEPVSLTLRGLERTDLDFSGSQFLDISLGQSAAADLVLEHIDTYTLARAGDERLLDASAEPVVVNHVELEQDVFPCLLDAFEDAFERCLAIDQQLGAVAGGQLHVGERAHGLLYRGPVVVYCVPGFQLPAKLAIDMIDLVGPVLVRIRKAFELAAAEHEVGRYGDERKRYERYGPGDRSLRMFMTTCPARMTPAA